MAFASPDPKRVEADRRRIAQRHIDDVRELETKRRIAREIQACYDPARTLVNGIEARGYCPPQIAHGHKMQENDGNAAARIEQAENAGIACWERIGRSRGGKRKGNLYRCLVQ